MDWEGDRIHNQNALCGTCVGEREFQDKQNLSEAPNC